MRADDLSSRFDDPASYRWVPLSALRAGEFLSCIDGRHDDCVIAGPGGDAGEALVLLATIEEAEGVAMGETRLASCMKALMDWHPRFYMHTDEAAVERLEEALTRDRRFDDSRDLLAVDHMRTLVQRPPVRLQDALLEYLVDPRFVGCGHLASVLTDPGTYGVREGLCKAVMAAFFRQMWDGSPSAQFVILAGVHEERAIIAIDVDGEADAGLFIPAVAAPNNAARLFVEHRPARAYLRRSFLDVLEHAGLVKDLPDAEVLERARLLGERHLETTLSRLAPDLPRFEVRFEGAHLPRVTMTRVADPGDPY